MLADFFQHILPLTSISKRYSLLLRKWKKLIAQIVSATSLKQFSRKLKIKINPELAVPCNRNIFITYPSVQLTRRLKTLATMLVPTIDPSCGVSLCTTSTRYVRLSVLWTVEVYTGLTAMMKGDVETPTNNVVCGKSNHCFFSSSFWK